MPRGQLLMLRPAFIGQCPVTLSKRQFDLTGQGADIVCCNRAIASHGGFWASVVMCVGRRIRSAVAQRCCAVLRFMHRYHRSAGWLACLVWLINVAAAQVQSEASVGHAAKVEFFENRIRPILVQHCYRCHSSADKARGDVALDYRGGMVQESSAGMLVVPGDPKNSVLLQVIRHEIDDLKMPEDGARLSDEVAADFEQWIRDGAVDPRDAPPSAKELDRLTSWDATLAFRKRWWSWQPVVDVRAPALADWSEHPVDQFVEREHIRRGLTRAPPADRRTIIRRLTYSLTGLLPTVSEVQDYLADDRKDAYEKLVDRLLQSPRYGEHWARHWMDLVRYADSHGSEGDASIPYAYQYRDYLIRCFNEDVAFDQFVREHVAGDLLPDPRINQDLGLDESAIGAAHWRMVFHGYLPTDALQEKVRFVDDQINVLGKTFLAQTISCARCHDHKFDAISQEDYYSIFGLLAASRPGIKDANSPSKRSKNQAALREAKVALRAALATEWQDEVANDLLGKLAAIATRSLRDHPGFLIGEIDHRVASGQDFESALRELATEVVDRGMDAEGRRWDFASAQSDGLWYMSGNGLQAGVTEAGAFALQPEGDAVVTGIYPRGVYSHLLSTRHRGVLHSARFVVGDDCDIWCRVVGRGAVMRGVVEDYPRTGLIFPVVGFSADQWQWQRSDLSYWKGDRAHVEVVTSRDAPVEVGSSDRSWFGICDVSMREKGAGPPPEELDPFGLLAHKSSESLAMIRDRDGLAGYVRDCIRDAVRDWSLGSVTDQQARLLDACLHHELLSNQMAAMSSNVSELTLRYRTLESGVPLPTRVPGLIEADALDQPLYVRGDHRKPGPIVSRRFLEAIDPEPYAGTKNGRLKLAEDLVRSDNPLTARVMVNRIWHYLFGVGIVATTNNFGVLGAEPSHPELLDYLATRFQNEGWSIKRMIRLLVTSKTWQLASAEPAAFASKDAEGVWLSHARVRRLDAEAIRDSMFVVSGQMDFRMGGAGFGANSMTPRRSVYVASRRNDMDAFLAAFDSPMPFAPVGVRVSTNVPAQSLTLLNGPLCWDVAARWSESLAIVSSQQSDEHRIAQMFESVTGRLPRSAEVGALTGYLDDVRQDADQAEAVRAASLKALHHSRDELAAIMDPVRDRLISDARGRDTQAIVAPIAAWDFRVGLEDAVGDLDGRLRGNAKIDDRGLILAGDGFFATGPIDFGLKSKTLVAVVNLDGLDQRGGGVLTVQDLQGNVFDSIVYGEQEGLHWIAGSDNFSRTKSFGGPSERQADARPVHLAISYSKDGLITAYRDGEMYGKPYRGETVAFDRGAGQILVGLRHGTGGSGRLLRGIVGSASVYDRALSPEEVRAVAGGHAFVSTASVLAALSKADRAKAIELQHLIAAEELVLDDVSGSSTNYDDWTLLAHALLNIKEFLYVR
jgi:hypothetical protein